MIDFGYFHCLPYGEHIKIKAFQELHKTAINQEQGTECLAPKKEPRLNPEGKMKKELGVRIYSGRDKINNGAFPILADALLLIK